MDRYEIKFYEIKFCVDFAGGPGVVCVASSKDESGLGRAKEEGREDREHLFFSFSSFLNIYLKSR